MALCVNIHADTGCCVALLARIHWQGGLGPKNQMTPFEQLNSHQIWCLPKYLLDDLIILDERKYFHRS